MRQLLDGEDIFVLDGFLTPEECAHYIAQGEAIGFEEATITTAGGAVLNKGVRDNHRAIVDSTDLAALLFERARPHLPPELRGGWKLVGLNERWRYYRYGPGERFAPHYDGYFARSPDERSHLTFMIYLNEDFIGGETSFYFLREEPYLSVQPRRGQALVFVHHKLHEGAEVRTGQKYVLRTDVLYRRAPQS